MNPICLIAGVGPGTGTALVRRFSSDYRVVMLARTEERLLSLERDFENCHAYPCDVADAASLTHTLDKIKVELGHPEIVIHNAVGGAFGDYTQTTRETLQKNFEVNTLALLQLAQELIPDMTEKGRGAVICTGNTSAFRGKASFAGFAPTKAAQRILAESIARAAGPNGVHVAYVAIDAVIDLAWTREHFSDKADDFFCHPDDIAQHVWQVAHQAKSVWTFESVIRPFGEQW